MDTEGSEVHIGSLPDPIKAEVGDEFTLTVRAMASNGASARMIPVSYDAFIDDVQVGERCMPRE